VEYIPVAPKGKELKSVRMEKKIIIAALLIAVVALVFYFFSQRGKETYATQKVTRQNLEEKVFASGELSSEKRVNLTFKISGRIAKIYLSAGDKVYKGQIIASLDKTELYNTLAQRESSYKAAVSNLQKVLDDIHLAQYGNGGFGNVGSANETQTQKNLRESAESARDIAYNQMQSAKNDLKNADLISPISGTITSVYQKEGENVVAYTTVVATVADLSKPIFEMEVDETDIGKIKENQEAKITLDAYPDIQISGKIYKIDPQITKTSEGTNIIKVKIRLDSFNLPPIIGLGGSAEIKASQVQNVLAIPQSAVFEKGNKKYVFVVEKGKAKQVEVKTGIESQDQVEIISGIEENQLVIKEKVDSVKEGQKIKI